MTEGATSILGAIRPYAPPTPYALPPGKSPRDIVGLGIAKDDHVYAGTGTAPSVPGPALTWIATGLRPAIPWHPDDRLPTSWRLTSRVPMTTSTSGIRTGTVSSGTSTDLDRHRPPSQYMLSPGATPREHRRDRHCPQLLCLTGAVQRQGDQRRDHHPAAAARRQAQAGRLRRFAFRSSPWFATSAMRRTARSPTPPCGRSAAARATAASCRTRIL